MKLTMRTYLKVCLNLCISTGTLLLCVFVVPKIIWFFMPFIVGWVIAWLAAPLVRFCEEKLRLKRKAGSAFVIVAVLALVVFLLYVILNFAIEQMIGFAAYIPQLWNGIAVELQTFGKKLETILAKLPAGLRSSYDFSLSRLGEYMADFVGMPDSSTIGTIGNVAKQIPNVIVCTVVALLSSYFFVADKRKIRQAYETYCPQTVKYRVDIIYASFKKAIGGYFKAQFKIEIWVYFVLVVGFLIMRIPYGWLIAIGIAFLDFLPIFGTGTVMVPWAVIEFIDGDYKMTIGLLITWGAGQLLRQIIQPKIVGDSVGLPALPTLLLIYLGYKFGGVGGMILAMPIGFILIRLYEEGMFDTTVKSIRILFAGVNHFRRIRDEDMLVVHDYERDVAEDIKKKEAEETEKE